RANANGFVSGVRFYKDVFAVGTHVGDLWDSTGTLLASATFNNETATGWQQIMFTTPVAITAGTTYVVSYRSTSHYIATTNYFATSGVDNGPLHALSVGE